MSIVLPVVVDPLGKALHFLRMSGLFYCRSEFSAPWALALPPMKGYVMLHAMIAGRCWLEVRGAPKRMLQTGDVALVPHGEGHQMASERGLKGTKLFEIAREQVSERYENLRLGGGGEAATAVCGVFQFDHPAAHQLVKLLPRILTIDAWNGPHMEWIQSTLRLMAAESRELRPGG